jgi:hypothetical protein
MRQRRHDRMRSRTIPKTVITKAVTLGADKGAGGSLITRRTGLGLFVLLTLPVIVAAFLAPRIGQPQSYHDFADRREWMGTRNFGDVLSNLPFAVIGFWGLWFLLERPPEKTKELFLDPRERWPYVVMSLVAAMIAERISVRVGLWLLPALLLIGVASVVQWHLSELRGAGDLRFYAAVQVYGALVPLLVLLLPARYTRTSDLAVVAGWYILAKVLETFDKQIFAASRQVVSGHTLKHLAAAMAGYWLLRMVQKRRPLGEARSESSRHTEGHPVFSS